MTYRRSPAASVLAGFGRAMGIVWYVALTRAKRSLGYALAPGNSLYLPAS